MKKTKKHKNKAKSTLEKSKKNIKKASEQNRGGYIYWLLLTIIIISGLYFRATNYAQEGIKNDAPTALAGGLLWFYPHNFYPGLMHYQPPVGHYLLASGCMLSGEDFSNISNASPYFIPNISYLIGRQYAVAENYCFLPVYIASILVFLGFALLSSMLLGKKESLFAIAFIAYNPTILSMGRNMFIWVFVWLFSLYGLIFLWKYYESKKGTRKESTYTIMAAAVFGIALATKFTLALFFIFSIFIILEKYKDNLNFSKGNAKIPLPLFKNILIFIVIFLIVTMIPYQLNPKNFIDVYNAQTSAFKQDAGLKPGLGTIDALKQFTVNMNIIDTIILLYSVFIVYSLFKKPQKDPKEKFILYNALLFIIATTLFTNQLGGTRAIPFFFIIPLLMALTFSDKEYSIYRQIKISINKTQGITYVIVIIYIILNIATLIPTTPYYLLRTNPLICTMSTYQQCDQIPSPANKLILSELSKILKNNETFYDPTKLTGETYFYLRNEDFYNIWLLETYIQKEYKVTPTIYDIIHAYNFNNRKIQYLVLHPNTASKEEKQIIESTTPLKTIKINNIPVAYIYNVDRLPNINKNS